eukprot:TRINITY_DN4882_c0_g1_i2.p1 TRINITY_DN4882_c0_g1~~TRINITY_DN4882_c0_g1_i2.p1  ORF type:complete len:242 (-),score=42.00 TRINITY_DN4882_c0_g1_i2:12-737(-)
MDWDVIGSDDYLGTVKVPIEAAMANEIDDWFPLTQKKEKSKIKTSGSLHLRISINIEKTVSPGRLMHLSGSNVSSYFALSLGWTSGKKLSIDLDASVIVLDSDKIMKEVIYCDFPSSDNKSINFLGDRPGDDGKAEEIITVAHSEYPQAQYILVVLYCASGQNFSSIKSAYMRVTGYHDSTTVMFSRVSEMEPKTGLVFGFFERGRGKGEWIFHCLQKFISGNDFNELKEECFITFISSVQ